MRVCVCVHACVCACLGTLINSYLFALKGALRKVSDCLVASVVIVLPCHNALALYGVGGLVVVSVWRCSIGLFELMICVSDTK